MNVDYDLLTKFTDVDELDVAYHEVVNNLQETDIDVAPASTLFSNISFSAEEGLCIISPAAIRSTTSFAKRLIGNVICCKDFIRTASTSVLFDGVRVAIIFAAVAVVVVNIIICMYICRQIDW